MIAGTKDQMMRDVIIEFISVGNVVKVTAVDTISGLEAIIVGDPAAPREHLKRLATQKLNYLLKKNEKDNEDGEGKSKPPGVVI